MYLEPMNSTARQRRDPPHDDTRQGLTEDPADEAPASTSPGDRLRHAREAAGYRSARAFALRHGFTESTYRHHENGHREFTNATAKRYARLLGVNWYWLVTGDNLPLQTGEPEIGVDAVRQATLDILQTVADEGIDAGPEIIADNIARLAAFYAERDGDRTDRLRLTFDRNVILFTRPK